LTVVAAAAAAVSAFKPPDVRLIPITVGNNARPNHFNQPRSSPTNSAGVGRLTAAHGRQ